MRKLRRRMCFVPGLEVCAGRFVLVGSCETGSPDSVSGRKAAGFASASSLLLRHHELTVFHFYIANIIRKLKPVAFVLHFLLQGRFHQ
jgi:hypothetical protein